MLTIEKLDYRIKNRKILSQITLSLGEGVYGLTGSNGSGKTTLMRCIAHICKPTAGRIERPPRAGYLPQKFGVFGELTVFETLDYFATLKSLTGKEKRKEIETVLEAAGLSGRAQDRAKTLSGGMMRRLGVAQALLGNPGLLLLDEPTVGLDQENREEFLELIGNIKTGRTVLISTHIAGEAERICDYIITLEKGCVTEFRGNLPCTGEDGRPAACVLP